jgi:hypothetical protein
VLQSLEDGQVKVHYVGWDAQWDEVVPRSRLRHGEKLAERDRLADRETPFRGIAPPVIPQPTVPVPARPSKLDAAAPGPIRSTDKPVTDATPLVEGMVLQVEWNKEWWAAMVIKVLPDGRARIHYLGWEARWDEDVPRARMQLDPDAAKSAGLNF